MRLGHEINKYMSESGLGAESAEEYVSPPCEQPSPLACTRTAVGNKPSWGAKGTPRLGWDSPSVNARTRSHNCLGLNMAVISLTMGGDWVWEGPTGLDFSMHWYS